MLTLQARQVEGVGQYFQYTIFAIGDTHHPSLHLNVEGYKCRNNC